MEPLREPLTEPLGERSTDEAATPASDAPVRVRYWAAARAAAGTDVESRHGATVGEVVDDAVRAHPALAVVVRASTFLVDGRKAGRDAALRPGATVEVLPPFAGG